MNIQTSKAVVRIKIAGVGGGGTNAVNRMIKLGIPAAQYISINTNDAAVQKSQAKTKIQIGRHTVQGRGAGANPQNGKRAAEESRKEIEEAIRDCDMLFITAGMGGGTGTGAAPVVAKIARKLGILTVAVVTKPFLFEGKKRMENALAGIAEMGKFADGLIVIPNDNLKHVTAVRLTIGIAFALADDVLMQTVRNLVDIMQQTAYINCDFADVCSIIRDAGTMHIATAQASGTDREDKMIANLKANVLLGSSVKDATRVLLYITAAETVKLEEIDAISSAISSAADPSANIIFGMNFEPTQTDELKAILIAAHGK